MLPLVIVVVDGGPMGWHGCPIGHRVCRDISNAFSGLSMRVTKNASVLAHSRTQCVQCLWAFPHLGHEFYRRCCCLLLTDGLPRSRDRQNLLLGQRHLGGLVELFQAQRLSVVWRHRPDGTAGTSLHNVASIGRLVHGTSHTRVRQPHSGLELLLLLLLTHAWYCRQHWETVTRYQSYNCSTTPFWSCCCWRRFGRLTQLPIRVCRDQVFSRIW